MELFQAPFTRPQENSAVLWVCSHLYQHFEGDSFAIFFSQWLIWVSETLSDIPKITQPVMVQSNPTSSCPNYAALWVSYSSTWNLLKWKINCFCRGQDAEQVLLSGLTVPAAFYGILRKGILKPLIVENNPPSKPQTWLSPYFVGPKA